MRSVIAAGVAGTTFGIGLTISGMINPAKVLNFLDIAGRWDPTLALVMAAALAVAVPGTILVRRRPKPLLTDAFQVPKRRDIDARLLAGAALFGIGWGTAGLCPGPAVSATVTGEPLILAFVAAMAAGMILYRLTGLR